MSNPQTIQVLYACPLAGLAYQEYTDVYPNLTLDTRPSMEGSGAHEPLQRAWVAVAMAFREIQGALLALTCGILNPVALPFVEEALNAPAELRAGPALFSTGRGAADTVDFDRHVWLETPQHVVDFTTFQIAPVMRSINRISPLIKGREGTWPPLICWAKRDLPKHSWGIGPAFYMPTLSRRGSAPTASLPNGSTWTRSQTRGRT